MTIRSASWLAAGLLATAASPALAQGVYDPGPPPPLPEWDEAFDESYADEAYDEEAYDEQADRPEVRREVYREYRGHPMPAHGAGGGFRYPPEQRAAWLEQCRATYRGRERGQVIGGVLGAVAGGVVGREIAERGDNLGGTLIGAGVGGIAGAAIGGAIGAEADRDECEAYLLRYEESYRGYGHGPAYGYAHGYAPGAVGYHYPYPYPVMWVRVPIMTERRDCGCETVVEEWVEEETAPPPVRRTKIRRIAAPDKRVRTGE